MCEPLFILIAKLAEKDGVSGLSNRPGLWTRMLDDQWEIAVNGHDEILEWPQTAERMGCKIQPYCCAVAYNGWLAGIFNPYSGAIAASDGANEANFIKALEAALEEQPCQR